MQRDAAAEGEPADAHAQVTRIVAIRHGETAWNAQTRMQGQLDTDLSRRGRWQAGRLAEALAGERLDAIIASDLRRAFETAQRIAAAQRLPVMADAGLRERGFGVFEGRTYAEIDAAWPADAARWRRHDPDFGAAGGETLRDFSARAVAAAFRIAAAHAGRSIALVSHGGVLDCLYRAAAGLALDAPRTWQLGNATINRLLWTPRGFALVGWNDESHLEGEPPLDDGSEGDGVIGAAAVARSGGGNERQRSRGGG